MAAELDDLRAGEIKVLLEGRQPYRSLDGEHMYRTKFLPFAKIRARGTTNPDFEYVVPTEYLFGDMLLSTHGTGGEEAAEFDRNLKSQRKVDAELWKKSK